MDLHEQEERDFGRDGDLWDANPDVCCAAFQLGACPHTEANGDEFWDEVLDAVDTVMADDPADPTEEEPF